MTTENNQVGHSQGDVVLINTRKGWPAFKLTVTGKSDVAISGTVDQVTAWENDNAHTPFETAHYLDFRMKWDGCCHVWFGDKADTGGGFDGYLHLCGADSWAQHIALMRWLFNWAVDVIPMKQNASGVLPAAEENILES